MGGRYKSVLCYYKRATLRRGLGKPSPREMVREAIFAEEMDFDCWGISEHHAVEQVATVSAPELLHAVVAYQTSRIKIRSM
mgnify:CR=1 FL=1